jgi:chromosome condensin MukBEF ATPase and DNA-binding subunit MukB
MDRYPDIKSRFEVLVEKVGRKARLAIIRRKGRNVIRKTGKRNQGRIRQRIEDIEGGAFLELSNSEPQLGYLF